MRSLLHPFSILLLILVAALCVLSISLRKRSPGAAIGALGCTFAGVVWGTLRAWSMDYVNVVAFSGEGIDPVTRYRELEVIFRRSDSIGVATIIAGVCALAAASGCLFAFEWRSLGRFGRGASIALFVAIALAFAPTTAMSRRSETLKHDTFAQAVLDVKTASTSEASCSALEDALAMNDRPTLETMLPDTRGRAHACIAERLACFDAHDGQCWNIMTARTEVWNQLHPGRHETILQLFVLESPLLLDERQKAAAMRRAEDSESASR